MYGKNGFAEVSKNLAKYSSRIILFDQNSYVERLSINDNAVKNFNTLAISVNVLHNYFNSSNKIIFRSS